MSQNNTDVWFRHTQELMLSYNRKKHSATKAAPFEVMFRRHSASTIDQQIQMNTEDNAARMIKAYQRKYGESAVEVYDIGDSVLVATRTEHEIKKMSQISITTMRKKNKLTAWSKKPFRITDKRMANGDELDLAPKKLSKAQQLAQMVLRIKISCKDTFNICPI